LGATIVMNIAILRPQCMASVITLGGNAKFIRGTDWPVGMDSSLLSEFSRELSLDKSGTLRRFAGLQVHGSDSRRSLLRQLISIQNECEMPPTSVLKSGLEILQTADLRKSLLSLRIPALLLFGEKDILVPAAAGEAMMALWQGAVVQVVVGGAHVLFLSHPKLFETAVTQFIFNGLQSQNG
ncbi:MAG: alpha/beta fold hydrolase, partial [Methylococcales bacterium]